MSRQRFLFSLFKKHLEILLLYLGTIHLMLSVSKHGERVGVLLC